MATKEVDLLGEAIAGTEAEIFGEAVNGTEVEAGEEAEPDRSLEAMDEVEEAEAGAEDEGEEEAEGDAEGEKLEAKPNRNDKGEFAAKDDASKDAKPEGDDKGKQVEKKGDPNVPLSAERQRRQTLEAELDKERRERAADRDSFRSEFAKLEGRLDQVLRTQQPPAPKAQEPKSEKPDKFVDPDGYDKWVEDQITVRVSTAVQGINDRFINTSMADAHEKHGKAFETAFSAVSALDKANPANSAVIRSIREAPNPGAALMRWHTQQETLREVGGDPAAYRKKVADEIAKDPEFRKQLMEELKAEARGGSNGGTNGNRPRNIIRNVPSLNGAAGRGDSQIDPRTYDNSEGGVFASAFEN